MPDSARRNKPAIVGAGAVGACSSAMVGTVSAQKFSMPGGKWSDAAAEKRMAREVVTAEQRILRGSVATSYAVPEVPMSENKVHLLGVSAGEVRAAAASLGL